MEKGMLIKLPGTETKQAKYKFSDLTLFCQKPIMYDINHMKKF